MTLSDIINTLKHDGTNPSINKEAIVKALEEVNKGEFLGDKDVKVKTIEQSEANYSFDFASLTPHTITSGLQYIAKYCRIEEINGILHLVWNFSVKNNTSSNAAPGWIRMTVTLANDIARKIFDFNNKHVGEDGAGAPIADFMTFMGTTDYPHDLGQSAPARLTNDSSANNFDISLYYNQNIKPNEEMYFSGRVALTLI